MDLSKFEFNKKKYIYIYILNGVTLFKITPIYNFNPTYIKLGSITSFKLLTCPLNISRVIQLFKLLYFPTNISHVIQLNYPPAIVYLYSGVNKNLSYKIPLKVNSIVILKSIMQ
jgi:hypothetical protein